MYRWPLCEGEPILNPILVAIFYGEKISLLSFVGEAIVFLGIIGYNVLKLGAVCRHK